MNLGLEKFQYSIFYLNECVCFFDQQHVHACYSMMVGDNNRRGSKRSLPCLGSNEIATSTYHSVLVDDVTDTAAAFATAVSARNKQIRLELTGIS
jgi:cyclin D5, plant